MIGDIQGKPIGHREIYSRQLVYLSTLSDTKELDGLIELLQGPY